MVDYGNNTITTGNWICISSAITGSGDSTAPSGTRIFLLSPGLKGSYDNMMKIKNMALGMSYSTKTGKKKNPLMITDCYVVKYGGVATNTEAFNLVSNQLRAFQKSGASPAYLSIANGIDKKTICLNTNNSGTAVYYLKGYVKGFDWDIQFGNIYHIKALRMAECSL